MKDIDWFRSICQANGMILSDFQVSQFEKYRGRLLAANRQLNLISRKDEENFYPNHALNSISFLFKLKIRPDASMLDLGTGGGLPGIPIRIICAGVTLVFVDSIAKKTAALSSILDEMKLERTRVVNGRGEELARKDEFQGRFDYVISRAAGKLDEIAKWSHGFLKSFESTSDDTIPVGTLIVLKGGKIEDELRRVKSFKFVSSAEVIETVFQGMDDIYNKEKKLVLIRYKEAPLRRKN